MSRRNRDYRPVRYNHDKPHRCPECHAVALRAWAGGYGPRTWLRCEYGCLVRWRTRRHTDNDRKAWVKRIYNTPERLRYRHPVSHLVLRSARRRRMWRNL